MGKKKDERKRREREAAMQAAGQAAGQAADHSAADRDCAGPKRHGHDRAHDSGRADRKSEGGTPFAGIAATIARQMGTPVGRQMIAAGLMAAATAIAKHDAKPGVRPTPPTPPAPPISPVPPVSPSANSGPAASQVEPDRDTGTATSSGTGSSGMGSSGTGPFAGDTPEPPRSETNALPPEFAKVIDTVTVGLERLFVGFGKPGAKKDPPAA